jgi:hypothetical protein
VVVGEHSQASERSGSPDLVTETLEGTQTLTQAPPGQRQVAALASHPSGRVNGGGQDRRRQLFRLAQREVEPEPALVERATPEPERK